jgi:hypothetical protein
VGRTRVLQEGHTGEKTKELTVKIEKPQVGVAFRAMANHWPPKDPPATGAWG